MSVSDEVRKLEEVADAALLVRWSPQTKRYWDELAMKLEATGRTKGQYERLAGSLRAPEGE